MTNEEIVKALREHAEWWAATDEWETPITLGDDLSAAADLIENQQNHIRALLQANDALRERQRWIPVTKRLPEGDGHYLCRYGFEGGKAVFYQTLDYYATDVQPHFQHEGMHGMHVTHWMPLPKAPEVESR